MTAQPSSLRCAGFGAVPARAICIPLVTEAALDQVAARFGETAPSGRVDRLVFLAALYWTTTPFRVDLY